jgi:hypothetical protein
MILLFIFQKLAINAATVENAFSFLDNALMTLSNKCAVMVHKIRVFMPFPVSE